VDEAGNYFRWRVRYSHDELLDLLRQKLPDAAEMTRLTNLRVTKRGISGRATEMVIEYVDGAGAQRELPVPDQYRIRQILHKSFLYSSAFAVEIERDSADQLRAVTLTGAGWGHGAGLCQIGALGMSLCGIDHERIVKHYFRQHSSNRCTDNPSNLRREFAFTLERSADSNPNGIVDPEHVNRRTPDRCDANQDGTVPSKVIGPLLTTRDGTVEPPAEFADRLRTGLALCGDCTSDNRAPGYPARSRRGAVRQ
jgi:hypothetical protein